MAGKVRQLVVQTRLLSWRLTLRGPSFRGGDWDPPPLDHTPSEQTWLSCVEVSSTPLQHTPPMWGEASSLHSTWNLSLAPASLVPLLFLPWLQSGVRCEYPALPRQNFPFCSSSVGFLWLHPSPKTMKSYLSFPETSLKHIN